MMPDEGLMVNENSLRIVANSVCGGARKYRRRRTISFSQLNLFDRIYVSVLIGYKKSNAG